MGYKLVIFTLGPVVFAVVIFWLYFALMNWNIILNGSRDCGLDDNLDYVCLD